MGSSYFGEPNMGSDCRGAGSSRKGKKNSDKPKQPQRGLGVAQLEKIRLHGQIDCSSYQYPSLHSPYPTNFNQEDMRMQSTAAAYSSISSSSSFSYSSSSSASSASYGFHPNMMMGVGEYERGSIRYVDSQSATAASWNPGSSMLGAQHFGHPNMITRHLLSRHVEDAQTKKSKKHRSDSMGSSSQNSESSDTQELDLELRLSL